MRNLGWVVVLLSCCEEPPAPKAAPAPVVKPEPRPVVELPRPPAPDLIAAFPDEAVVPEDASTEERLLRLLLVNPHKAEAALHELTSPDGWQVAVLAQFALLRGEKTFDLEPEPALPLPGSDGGVVGGPGPAWLAEDADLLGPGKQGKALAHLPLNTKVEVKSLDGDRAQVSVAIAQLAIYGDQDPQPTTVSSTPVVGRLALRQLSSVRGDAEALMSQAGKQGDDGAGRLRAVALWQHAWRVERSERSREGLLRAAWAARRASTVVRAALAQNLAPVSGLRFAWACTTGDPAHASWLDVSTGRPRRLPRSVCLSGVDARAHCKGDPEPVRERAEQTRKWLDAAGVGGKPWLRFTVDAREPRQVFLITTPLEVADPCSEFEELTFEAISGLVRRLTLPLGTRGLVVWVPVTRQAGAEYSIPSAASESQAVSWLRSRARYRWTLGAHGELEPSLNASAMTYAVSGELTVTSYALPPERDCSCD